MRLIAGTSLILEGSKALVIRTDIGTEILAGLSIGAGLLLAVGLWTAITGWLVALLGVWQVAAQTGDPRISIFLGGFGASLALLGPGAYSADARLYGWKRINIGDR